MRKLLLAVVMVGCGGSEDPLAHPWQHDGTRACEAPAAIAFDGSGQYTQTGYCLGRLMVDAQIRGAYEERARSVTLTPSSSTCASAPMGIAIVPWRINEYGTLYLRWDDLETAYARTDLPASSVSLRDVAITLPATTPCQP